MGIYQSKVKCLYSPAQSGKTQKSYDRIELYKETRGYLELPEVLDIWISSNNQLLVQQTASRFDKTYNWISKNEEKLQIESLAYRIIEDIYDMVLMCSNNPRVPVYLIGLINSLEKSNNFTKKINIWIDEGDQSINLWSNCNHIISKSIIDQVTIVSGTLTSVRKEFGRLHVIGYAKPCPECYRSLKDSKKIICDFEGSPEDYIEHVLEKYPKLSEPGMKAFLPGSFKKDSHLNIKDNLLKRGFAVMVINSDGKVLYIGKNKIPIDSNDSEEFKETLARIYIENKLYELPFAITGRECVCRGITFQTAPVAGDHEGFIFDYGIILKIFKSEIVYQLTARLFGNTGDFSNYKPCEIYTTSSNFKKIEKEESMAMNIPKMVHERGLESVGEEEFKEASYINDSKYGEQDAPTFIELKKIMSDKYSQNITRRAIHENSQGILVSTKYGQPIEIDKTSEEHKKYDDLIPVNFNTFRMKSKGSYLSKKANWVVIPVYENFTKGTEVWYCRFIKKEN
jgi:hypothetical protein